MITKTVLCDADFLIALCIVNEPNHELAKEILAKYNHFVVLNITFYEVATVLSRKLIQPEAVDTLERIQEAFCNVIYFLPINEFQTFKLYKSFTKKNISFFDCACSITARNNDFLIASFDKFYPLQILA